MQEVFYQQLKGLVKENQLLLDEPLAKHTSFQIGGPAKYLVMPENISQIQEVVKLCQQFQEPFFVLGNGSNLLVSDNGFNGTIIKLGQGFQQISMSLIHVDSTDEKKCLVRAEAGVKLSKLAKEIADFSLEGFEFASGIPGTLGGAVTMNAGAYGGEIKHAIKEATLMDQNGTIFTLSKEEMELDYRESIVQKNQYIVLEAVFEFSFGDKDKIWNKINELNGMRREKQPLEFPSAGSTFKRPEGHFAGKLIMDADLAGYQVGNAMVSKKHCGFVINLGGATAKEVVTLISDVSRIVYEKYGVKLEPEVRFLGEF